MMPVMHWSQTSKTSRIFVSDDFLFKSTLWIFQKWEESENLFDPFPFLKLQYICLHSLSLLTKNEL